MLIVAMTAYAMQGDAEKCYASGMDIYISKSVEFKKIKEILNYYEREKKKSEHKY